MTPAIWKLGAATAIATAALTAHPAKAGHLNIVLEADLDGRQEVANATNTRLVGDPRGKGEAYVFGIDGDPATLCYVLLVEGIGEVNDPPGNGRMAHIHKGAPGANGPVVATLAWPQDGRAADCLSEDEPGKFARDANGGLVVTVAEILTEPEGFYVNVHNAQYPGGAIRGQLHDTLDTSHDD